MRDVEPKEDENMIGGALGVKKTESQKTYPSIRLEHQYFPEIKKWKVGEEYTVTLKLKQTGISISKYQNDSNFEIHGFEVESSDGKKDNEEDKKGDY